GWPSPRCAHTVCQSRHRGPSRGACPSAVRQPARAAAWLGWYSPYDRTTRVWGIGTWRSHRCRKAATGKVIRWSAVAVVRHQAGVLDGTTPQVPRPIRHHTSAMAIALHDPHVPLGLLRVTQALQEIEHLLRAPRRGQSQRTARKGLLD